MQKNPRTTQIRYLCLFVLALLLAACSGRAASPPTKSEAAGETASPVASQVVAPTLTELPEPTVTPLAPTDQPPTVTPNPTATFTLAPSPTATISPDPLVITDWIMTYFDDLPYGCMDDAPICWKGVSRFKQQTNGIVVKRGWGGSIADDHNAVLLMKQPVEIDPVWPNVYLTFWHKYSLNQPVIIRALVDGRWVSLTEFRDRSTNRWKMEAISLNGLRGKAVQIEISSVGAEWWLVQDVQIQPNFIAPETGPTSNATPTEIPDKGPADNNPRMNPYMSEP